MSNSLQGHVAVVTGAARGLGKEMALELARLGADVVVAGRSGTEREVAPGTIYETADAIRSIGARAHPALVDIGFQEGVDELLQQTLDAFGRVDVLVNNSAITNRLVFLSVDELSREQFERQLSVNLVAPLMLTKAVLAPMRAQGHGVIINMTSAAARMQDVRSGSGPTDPKAGYSVTKYALERLTHQLAQELYAERIACIALDPGSAMTEYKERAARSGSALDAGRTHVDERTHPGWWPARVAGFLASCPDPLAYTGEIVVTDRTFLEERGLLEPPPDGDEGAPVGGR